MQYSVKKMLLGICFVISASPLGFATSQPIATVEVSFRHLTETGYEGEIPEKGKVYLQIDMVKHGALGIKSHHAKTPGLGLILDDYFDKDTVEGDAFNPNPIGTYTITLICRGVNKFAGQSPSLQKSFNLKMGTKKVDIIAFCPSKGNVLLAPKIQEIKYQ